MDLLGGVDADLEFPAPQPLDEGPNTLFYLKGVFGLLQFIFDHAGVLMFKVFTGKKQRRVALK